MGQDKQLAWCTGCAKAIDLKTQELSCPHLPLIGEETVMPEDVCMGGERIQVEEIRVPWYYWLVLGAFAAICAIGILTLANYAVEIVGYFRWLSTRR